MTYSKKDVYYPIFFLVDLLISLGECYTKCTQDVKCVKDKLLNRCCENIG